MSKVTQSRQRFSRTPYLLGVSGLLMSGILLGEPVLARGYTSRVDIFLVSNQLTGKSMILGDDYPAWLKNAVPDSVIDPWRLYNRECVSFVAHRLEKINGFKIPGAYGNAYEWGSRAQSEGYRVDKIPQLGSIAWWRSGHVAWVSEIKGNNVVIEEYNFGYNHRYNMRIVPIATIDGFIHFKDLSSANSGQISSSQAASKSSSNLPSRGNYRFTHRYPIRGEAKLSSPELASYDVGESVNYDRLVEGDGYKWISYVSYSGQRRYVAVEKLQQFISEPLVETPLRPAVDTGSQVSSSRSRIPSSGTYRFTKKSGIKNSPNLSSPDIAYYNNGDSVNYDKVVTGEGKQWISYVSYSGSRRYITID